MDPSSIPFFSSLASFFHATFEFLGRNAFILFIYTAIATFTARAISKASKEFQIRGSQVAEFFRMDEK